MMSSSRWSHRPPPAGLTADNFKMCKILKEGSSCPYGPVCIDAHSDDELEEWFKRDVMSQDRTKKNCNDHDKSSAEMIHMWIATGTEERSILKEHLSGVNLRVDADATVTLRSKKESSTWLFNITTKDRLTVVTLLDKESVDNFSLTSLTRGVVGSNGVEEFVLPSSEEWKDEDHQVQQSEGPENCYRIKVEFRCKTYGTFEQRVVMSFDRQPTFLYRSLKVVVRPVEIAVQPEDLTLTESKRWESLPAVKIVRAPSSKHPSEEKLLQEYQRPEDMKKCMQTVIDYQKLTPTNYKHYWHSVLYIEEAEDYHSICRFQMAELVTFSRSYKMETAADDTTNYALPNELFGRLPLGSALSEDSVAGRILLQNVNSLLLAITSGSQPDTVFECEILDRCRDFLMISVTSELIKYADIVSETSRQCQVQFVINRVPFCEMHSAIDKFSHTPVIYPDVSAARPPNFFQMSFEEDSSLNSKQNACLAVALTREALQNMPPILLIGPFGTGKTKTFATSILHMLEKPVSESRILICTLSNSAADLYIKDYIDPHHKKFPWSNAKVLRIYYKHRRLASVSETVQAYTLFDEKTLTFRDPTWEDLKDAKVVIVTLKSCFSLTCLNLPKGFFSHIMVDEAAQAMELETLIPLVLADKNTKVFLAGDHMQINPENVFSSVARKHHLQRSLFERLTNLYPEEHPSKIVLNVNYRSHEALVEYSSGLFYNGKLLAGGEQLPHPFYYPLTFLAARGESRQHGHSTGYTNMSEIHETVEYVDELFKYWPVENWGKFQENSIGVVVPYMDQVILLRTALKQRNAKLREVSVERVYNVQGKQFRVIVINAVRTIHTCRGVNEEVADYGFLSNPKLLNTAITRAQSLVTIVGDPFSMCSVGKCRSLWVRFLEQCASHESLIGVTFPQIQDYMDYMDVKKAYKLDPHAHDFVPSQSAGASTADSAVTSHSAQQAASLLGNPMFKQFRSHIPPISPYPPQNQMLTGVGVRYNNYPAYGLPNHVFWPPGTGGVPSSYAQPRVPNPIDSSYRQVLPQQTSAVTLPTNARVRCKFIADLRESWRRHSEIH